MTFVLITLLSCLVSAVLLLASPGPPVGPVAALVALWLLPGYALQAAAMGPGRRGMGLAERLVVSIPLSLALLAGVSVLYEGLGNELSAPAIIWISFGVTQAASLAGIARAVWRRERMRLGSLRFPPLSWAVPAMAIGIVVVGGLSVLAWKPPPRADLYVELSILDRRGMAPPVPLRVHSAETYEFTIRITSREASSADYELRIDGPDRIEPRTSHPFVLAPGQRIDVGLRASWTATDEPLTVTLDRNGNAAYRSLRLAVQVDP